MKNIFKYILIAIVFVSFSSCEDSDLVIDNLYDNVDVNGAVLRMLSKPDDIVNISGGNFDNAVRFTLEVQEGDGSFTPNFKEVRVFVATYDDQDFEFPTLDEDGNEFGENLFEVIPNSAFDTLSEINGLPMLEYSMPTVNIVESQAGAIYNMPTFIYVRFELEMNNGQVWTVSNAGTTLGGPYFLSPFEDTTIFLNN